MSVTAEDLSTVTASKKLFKLCRKLVAEHEPHLRSNSLTRRLVLQHESEVMEISEFKTTLGGEPTCYQVRMTSDNTRYQVAEEPGGCETHAALQGSHYERISAEDIEQLCERLKAADLP